MSVLAEIYASNPSDDFIIHALVIEMKNEVVRICTGFENLYLDGQLHEAGNISVSLPKRANTGQQTLTFGVWNSNGIAQDYVDRALEDYSHVYVTYSQYLSSDLDNPIDRTPKMPIVGGSFSGMIARFEASFHDLLNTAFPRQRFTNETAPAIQYMQ